VPSLVSSPSEKVNQPLSSVEGDAQGYDDRAPSHYSGPINESSNIPKEQRDTQRDTFKLLSILNSFFRRHGQFVARHPFHIIILSVLFTAVCSLFITQLTINTQPEKLWVPPNSIAATNKAYFDQVFGPFYRVEQLIITSTLQNNNPILTKSNLIAVLNLQDQISNLTVEYNNRTYQLRDLCYRPVLGQGCIVESVLGYWKDDLQRLLKEKNILEKIAFCIDNPIVHTCMTEVLYSTLVFLFCLI
jgi:Niemann-Pick C1 protein